MNKQKIFLLLLLFSSLRLSAQYVFRSGYAIDHQGRHGITGDSTIARKVYGDSTTLFTVGNKEVTPLFLTIKYSNGIKAGKGIIKIFDTPVFKASGEVRNSKDHHTQAARKWSFKAMMYAICNYFNNGLRAKYQPAVFLTADTR